MNADILYYAADGAVVSYKRTFRMLAFHNC